METEEGFNLAVRRMLRSSQSYYVIHVAYSQFGFMRSNKELRLLLQNTAIDLTQPLSGQVYQMRRGDQFIVFNESVGGKVAEAADSITAAAFPDRKSDDVGDQVLARVFRVPQDYIELRRAANVYLEEAMGNAPAPPAAVAEPTPLSEELDGPLTAWALSRIEGALLEMDIGPYLRTQTVFQTDHNGGWEPLFEEHFISVPDLQRDKFPKLQLRDDRLFIELFRALDRRSVPEILRRHRGKPGHRISLNVALETCSSAFFEKFLRESGDFERKSLVLEFNRSDLLHQPRETVKALARLREAGFAVALDGVTLDLLAITSLHRVACDYFKISLLPATMWLLKDADCVAALKKLPRDRIILCRCEKDSALPVGKAFGLNKFQGWMIDRLAAGEGEKHS